MMTLNQKRAGVKALNDLAALTVDEWDIDGVEMEAFRVIHKIMYDAVDSHIDSSDVNFDIVELLEATPVGQYQAIIREQAKEIKSLQLIIDGNTSGVVRTPEQIKSWAAAKLIESTLTLRKQQSGE